jgi:hypothetical protein
MLSHIAPRGSPHSLVACPRPPSFQATSGVTLAAAVPAGSAAPAGSNAQQQAAFGGGGLAGPAPGAAVRGQEWGVPPAPVAAARPSTAPGAVINSPQQPRVVPGWIAFDGKVRCAAQATAAAVRAPHDLATPAAGRAEGLTRLRAGEPRWPTAPASESAETTTLAPRLHISCTLTVGRCCAFGRALGRSCLGRPSSPGACGAAASTCEQTTRLRVSAWTHKLHCKSAVNPVTFWSGPVRVGGMIVADDGKKALPS